MRARLLVLAALLLTVAGVKASDLPLPAGHERWIVVLGRDASPSAVGELVRTLGGQVESDLIGRVVITAPTAAIEQVLAHPGVKYVQPTAVGVPPADVMRVQPEASIDAPIQSDALTWTSGEYRYDGAGNIVSIGTAAAPGTQGYRTYSYDKVSRLTKAQISGTTPSGIYEYSYDDYGNRTGYAVNSQWVTVPVSATNNRLTDATYDVPGNQKTRGSTTATYDGFGMMKSYEFDGTGTNQETFVYTANDERIGVLRGTEWTWSLRDSGGRVLRQYRSSSTNTSAAWLWVEDFVYRDHLPLGGERVPEEGGRRHYHLDHLGSTRLVTGQFGSVISEHDFLPFGEERTAIPQHQAKGFDREEPHRFTGHERDFDTPTPNDSSAYIDYMHARFYATKTGRFLSVDPSRGSVDLQHPQTWNRYSYALNNPLNRIDPDGRVSYLVARNGPGPAAHMFIVTHARYVGDPRAIVRSFGRSSAQGREGKLGRVGPSTTGMSAGTYADDVRTWRALGKTDAASRKTAGETDYVGIAAKDGKVASVADAVKENNKYQLDGPNSNSAAQAVAERAQGSPVTTPDSYDIPTGIDEKDKVKFDESKIKKDELNGVHQQHVPPI